MSTCAQWRNGGQRQRAGPCLRATCTHGCAGRRGHAKDCPGSRARASPADRYGGKSLTAVVPAARQPSSRAVGWRVASDFLPPPPRVCPVHPLARCRASEAESSAESGRPGTAEAGHACWGEPRRDCVSCSHSRLEVPRQNELAHHKDPKSNPANRASPWGTRGLAPPSRHSRSPNLRASAANGRTR